MSKKYYWLKLKDNFFNQREIKKLRKIAGGDTYTIIYLKLQLLTIKNEAVLEYEGTEDNIYEQLSLELDETIDNIKVTFLFLEANGLIEKVSDYEYLLPETKSSIGRETDSADRKRRQRMNKGVTKSQLSHDSVTKSHTEIEKEIELEIDKYSCNFSEKNDDKNEDLFPLEKQKIDKPKRNHCPYEKIKDLYNKILVYDIKRENEEKIKRGRHSEVENYLSECMTLTSSRKRAMKARWQENPDLDTFEQIFYKVKTIDFLMGRKKLDKPWRINIDGIMNENKFTRIKENYYD